MRSSDLYMHTWHMPTHRQINKTTRNMCLLNLRIVEKQANKQKKIPYLLEHLQPRVLKTPSTAKDEGGCWRKSYLLQREYKVTQPCGLMVWQLLTRLDVLVTRSSSGGLWHL